MPLSNDDYEQATFRIAYEMYHFRCLVRIYRDGNLGRGLWWQLVSQSLLLHLRVIIEFFYWHSSYSRDISIRHYAERNDFAFPPELYAAPLKIVLVSNAPNVPDEMTLKQVKEALDQRLVHFGQGRWTGYHPRHEDYDLCFDDLERRIVAFRTALPDDLKRVFDERLAQFADRDTVISVPISEAPSLAW